MRRALSVVVAVAAAAAVLAVVQHAKDASHAAAGGGPVGAPGISDTILRWAAWPRDTSAKLESQHAAHVAGAGAVRVRAAADGGGVYSVVHAILPVHTRLTLVVWVRGAGRKPVEVGVREEGGSRQPQMDGGRIVALTPRWQRVTLRSFVHAPDRATLRVVVAARRAGSSFAVDSARIGTG